MLKKKNPQSSIVEVAYMGPIELNYNGRCARTGALVVDKDVAPLIGHIPLEQMNYEFSDDGRSLYSVKYPSL